jgi:hypothetical protein
MEKGALSAEAAGAEEHRADPLHSSAQPSSAQPSQADAPDEDAAQPEPVAEPVAEPAAEPVAAPEREDPNAVAGANLGVGSLTADGLTLNDVSCRADGLGFLGSVVIAGSLAKKKAALDACARGKSPRVRWSFAGNRVTAVSAAGVDDKAVACLKKALVGAAAPGEGECAATLVL